MIVYKINNICLRETKVRKRKSTLRRTYVQRKNLMPPPYSKNVYLRACSYCKDHYFAQNHRTRGNLHLTYNLSWQTIYKILNQGLQARRN